MGRSGPSDEGDGETFWLENWWELWESRGNALDGARKYKRKDKRKWQAYYCMCIVGANSPIAFNFNVPLHFLLILTSIPTLIPRGNFGRKLYGNFHKILWKETIFDFIKASLISSLRFELS